MAKDSESRFGRQDALTPFRAMAEAPTRTYRIRENRVEVKLPSGRGRKPTGIIAYSVTPISTDIGGLAFRLNKLDGTGGYYDVLLGCEHASCTCDGWTWTDRPCKHIKALLTLLELGVLAPAPASAAGDGGGRAA